MWALEDFMKYTGEGCWSGLNVQVEQKICIWNYGVKTFWQAAVWKTEKGVRG